MIFEDLDNFEKLYIIIFDGFEVFSWKLWKNWKFEKFWKPDYIFLLVSGQKKRITVLTLSNLVHTLMKHYLKLTRRDRVNPEIALTCLDLLTEIGVRDRKFGLKSRLSGVLRYAATQLCRSPLNSPYVGPFLAILCLSCHGGCKYCKRLSKIIVS